MQLQEQRRQQQQHWQHQQAGRGPSQRLGCRTHCVVCVCELEKRSPKTGRNFCRTLYSSIWRCLIGVDVGGGRLDKWSFWRGDCKLLVIKHLSNYSICTSILLFAFHNRSQIFEHSAPRME